MRKIVALIILFLAVFPLPSLSAERGLFRIRYLFSINAAVSGQPFSNLKDIFIDGKRGELYALDSGNRRVVITDLEGVFLYQFRFEHSKIGPNPVGIIVAEDGAIYVAEPRKVVVLNYNGKYRNEMDLSTVPGSGEMLLQSIAIEGEKIYLGDVGGGRVAVAGLDGRFIAGFDWKGGKNIRLSMDDERMFVMDPAIFSVFRLDKEGSVIHRFGQVSSLPGGFSMLADFAVDRKNGRVLVLDSNRFMVIAFSREGNFLFEFGGPQMFSWPGTLAVDSSGRIYVFDGSQKIRVFEAIEEAPAVEEPASEGAAPSAAQEGAPKGGEAPRVVEKPAPAEEPEEGVAAPLLPKEGEPEGALPSQ